MQTRKLLSSIAFPLPGKADISPPIRASRASLQSLHRRSWLSAAWTAVILGLGVSPSLAVEINQHGLTGSWYDPASNGQGFEIEVFKDLRGPGHGLLQAGYFGFGRNGGQRWYTFSGDVFTGQSSALLTIYQNIGGNFNAPPITNPQVVGTATIDFSTCTLGRINYQFNDGLVGTFNLYRLAPNVSCVPIGNDEFPPDNDFGLSGNFYAPMLDGQGMVIEINNRSPVAFLAWYTYAINGASLGLDGQRWITGQATYIPGARFIPLALYETTGGFFNQPNPPTSTQVGFAQLGYQTCTWATFQYTFTAGSFAGQSGTLPLWRIGPVPAFCD